MKIYKVVPNADSVVVKKNETAQNAILKFYDVIKQEAVDGWEFHSASPVNVTRKLGKFKKREEKYYAFVFCKEVDNK